MNRRDFLKTAGMVGGAGVAATAITGSLAGKATAETAAKSRKSG